ncbi:MAG: aminoglycoside 3'-phosphotransferase [Clostridia bacterium]|nr:aminoglycoside 3'-phosphotransferase [Clostridia bacterium]
MKRTLITPDVNTFPSRYCKLLENARIYDSSCSPEACVYFIDADGGYYLKTAKKGSLLAEAEMTRYFHSKGLATRVADYISLDRDWLLTEKLSGEDCTHKIYLFQPEKLCDTIAELLRGLHETDFSDCPVQNRIERYKNTVLTNHEDGVFDSSFGFGDAKEAFSLVEKNIKYLQNDTLLHGDYCLPNIMLDNWRFSGFIDLDNGGVGDRHIDIFWGIWTLQFNLGTNEYASRFIDAYGREKVDKDMLRLIAACESFG